MGKAMYKSSAECVEYTLAMEGEPPAASEDFIHAVNALSGEDSYYYLFQLFGLSYPTSVVFGARYGYMQTIKESSYKELTTKYEKFAIGAEVSKSYEKTYKGVTVEGTAAVKGEYSREETTSESKEFEEAFEEKKEFSLGKKLPAHGDAQAWASAAQGEAMPIRYNLVSICEHPFWAAKKADCDKYRSTYCSKFLSRLDSDVRCDAEIAKPECMWDIDCLTHQICIEGTCAKEPDCIVTAFSGSGASGSARPFGPFYYTETPQGRIVDVGGDIKSVKISGGCEEVVLFDQDKCKDNYVDNGVMENRNTNDEQNVNLRSDLRNDVCRMKVLPKRFWAA